MLEYPITIYEPKCWTVYLHTVPKEIRSSPDRDDYYDKYYVGITSRDINERWGVKGYEYKNQIFNNAIQKYGWDNIKHEIIAVNLYRKVACMFEIYLIERLQSFVKNGHGYNATKGGEGFLGVKRFGKDNSFYGKHHTKEQREKWSREKTGIIIGEKNPFYGKHHSDETRKIISEKNKQRYRDNPESFKGNYVMSEERKREVGRTHSKPVYVFDMNLNFIGEYPSVLQASICLKISRRVAETIVNNGRKADYEYIIKFKSEVPDVEEFQKTYQIRTYTSFKFTPNTNYEVINPVYQLDKDYNFIHEFKNAYEASEKTGVDISKIKSCCDYGRKYADGFVFVRKNSVSDLEKYIRIKKRIREKKGTAVMQYDFYGNFIRRYASINDAKNTNGYTYYSIYSNCENNTSSGNGYIWRYEGVDYE